MSFLQMRKSECRGCGMKSRGQGLKFWKWSSEFWKWSSEFGSGVQSLESRGWKAKAGIKMSENISLPFRNPHSPPKADAPLAHEIRITAIFI
jgi:hypothetical protein